MLCWFTIIVERQLKSAGKMQPSRAVGAYHMAFNQSSHRHHNPIAGSERFVKHRFELLSRSSRSARQSLLQPNRD
jgi:hypothetical protein